MNENKKKLIIEEELYNNICMILNKAKERVYRAVNFIMVEAYWNIGKLIVNKQGGKDKAKYGDSLIINLSKSLTEKYGRGFDTSNLLYMKRFYTNFKIKDALRPELSWTHYRLLLKIENVKAREYYINECINDNWSTRQLERQINSFYYERLLSNKVYKKEEVDKVNIYDYIKDPYILEFLELKESTKLYESSLEQALINHLQKFLLELGNGFTFVCRQKRISLDGDNFYIDLVFYNLKLRCYVLIDLKIGELMHQDIGQMQMYVNYYTRELMNKDDNIPIGIVLCLDKNESIVKYTLPENNKQIYASKYMLYLPSEEKLAKVIQDEKEIIEREKRLCN